MKNKILKNKNKIIIFFLWLIHTIYFFSHNLLMCWDSSVYLGMSLVIGTSAIKDVWLSVRGISFPFLLRLFEPFGFQNKYFLLVLTYIFYMYLIIFIYKIGKKTNLFQNRLTKYIYIFFVIAFIIINPYVFVYYHLILTEFIVMTLNIIFVYLLYNFIRLDVREKIKKSFIYAIGMSAIITFLYHTKQSFLGMMAIDFAIGLFLSFFRHFDIKNILFKVFTCLLCASMLVGSVKVWNSYMNNKGVGKVSENAERYTSHKALINGLSKLKDVANSSNLIYNNGEFKKTVQVITNGKKLKDIITIHNEKDKEEILNVLNKKSIYKDFTVYEDEKNDKIQYVLFTKNNYSVLEQLPLYFRIFVRHPLIIVNSYYEGMYNTIWIPGKWAFENEAFVVNYFYYNDRTNVMDVAPGYEYAVEDLETAQHTNILDHLSFGYAVILRSIYRVNQMLVPILFTISLVLTIIVILKNRKDSKYDDIRNNLEMVTLLYGMAFGCIISYIAFNALIDRYLIPSHIPMFLADALFIISIIKLVKLKQNKILVKIED